MSEPQQLQCSTAVFFSFLPFFWNALQNEVRPGRRNNASMNIRLVKVNVKVWKITKEF